MDRRLIILALGMFAVGTNNFVIADILPSISTSLNTSASAAGQMVSIYALSFVILARRCRGRMVTQIPAHVGTRNLCCWQRA
jgi:MFS family permease